VTRERLRAYLFSTVMIVAVGAPAFRSPDEDSYPLSTYPMFSRRRGRINTVMSALAIAGQRETKIPPEYVANAETMQAFRTLTTAVAAGGDAAQALCQTIAGRLPGAKDPALARAERVELVSESVDAIDYLAGRAKPEQRRVHARCVVDQSKEVL
jgi:hypothetical protein